MATAEISGPDNAPGLEADFGDGETGFLLWQVSNAWQRRMRNALDPLGLTYVQAILLVSLVRLEERSAAAASQGGDPALVTQGQLAQICEADPTMTSQVLRALEQKGLIKRQIGDDARTRHPRSTETGREFAAKAAPVLVEVDHAFFAEGLADQLSPLLRKLHDS